MSYRIVIVLILACFAGPIGCRTIGRNTEPIASAPDYWARPLHHPELEGLVVLRRSDVLYNSAQPEPEHFTVFNKMGIRTVVNIRTTQDDREVATHAGLNYYALPVSSWDADTETIVEFLRVASDPANQPVLVYCWYGGDRSNMMAAAYRVVVEGWTKEEAIREMTEGGTWFHPIWQNMVDEIRELDVEAVRQRAGIDPPPRAQASGSEG